MVKKLDNEKAGELFKIILSYVNDEDPQVDDILLNIAFEPIKQSLKRHLREWEEKMEQRSINGRLGNLKRYNPEVYEEYKTGKLTLKEAEDLIIFRKTSHSDNEDRNESQNLANVAVNVNGNGNVNVNGNVLNTEYSNNNIIKENLIKISGFEKLSEEKKSTCFLLVSNEKSYEVVDDEFLNSGIITFLDKENYLKHREATAKKFKVPDVFYFNPNQMKFYSFYDLIFYMTSDELFLEQVKLVTKLVKPEDVKSWIRFYAEHAFTSNERNSIHEMKKHMKFSWSSIPGKNFKNLKFRS